METYFKDPDAELDWLFDWKAKTNGTGDSDWLASTETISSHTISVESGLTKDSDSESNGAVIVWLSGGTVGEEYSVACRIVTSENRTDERTIKIRIKER